MPSDLTIEDMRKVFLEVWNRKPGPIAKLRIIKHLDTELGRLTIPLYEADNG